MSEDITNLPSLIRAVKALQAEVADLKSRPNAAVTGDQFFTMPEIVIQHEPKKRGRPPKNERAEAA